MLTYQVVRDETMKLCEPLEHDDFIVQPHSFVSPPKWHLGHTTWFFEAFLLRIFFEMGFNIRNFNYVFNSYYESQGNHIPQGQRG